MAGALVTTNILQTVVSFALAALRERIVLARIANRDRQGDITGLNRNATVNISVPASITAQDVAPDVVPQGVSAVTPTSIPLTLNRWKYAPFVIDDKGLAQVNRGIMPQQLGESVKAIVNAIELDAWSLLNGASGFYGYSGVAGTTPFASDLAEYDAAVLQSDLQLMPRDMERRYVILDPYAHSKAIGTAAVQNAGWRGDPASIRTGEIGALLGANWTLSQHVPLHTAGTAAGATTNTAGYAVGVKTVTLASAGTGTILVGDVLTFAGDTQTYVVTSGDADVSNGGTISFEPGLKVAIPTSATAITLKGTHRMNLLIHGDALAFAMAPLADDTQIDGLPRAQAVAIDPDSGLALRLKITEQHYQVQWALDALWGFAMVRREFGVRIAG